MPIARMWKLFAGAIIALFLTSMAAADGPLVSIENPWARASILKSRPGVVYLTVRNDGATADRMVGAASPIAESVMIHATEMSGGTMRMHAVPGLEIDAGSQVTLGPGGIHLMLMGLREKLVEGRHLPLVVTFERAGTIELQVPILSFAAKGPDGRQ